jgi:hypothetical protein
MLGCGVDSAVGAPGESRLLISLNEKEESALCQAQNALVARDPDYLEAACFAKSVVLSDGDARRREEERVRCLAEVSPACDPASPPRYRKIAEAVDCPKLTVGMVLACNKANAPRSKQGYAGITCESDAEQVSEELVRLLEQQLSDPPDGCEAALDACAELRTGF